MVYNDKWYAQTQPVLTSTTVEERTKEYLKYYGYDNYQQRDALSKEIGITTPTAVCIAKSETTLGRHLASNHNLRNCMNNDRGQRVGFESFEEAFRQLWSRCLNWRYLKAKTDLNQLYPNYPHSKCYTDPTYPNCKYVFASSPFSAPVNVQNCLSNIYNKQIDMNYKFRI